MARPTPPPEVSTMLIKLELKLFVLKLLGLVGALIGLGTTFGSGCMLIGFVVLSFSCVIRSIDTWQLMPLVGGCIAAVVAAFALYILWLSLHIVRVCSLIVFPQLGTLCAAATPEEMTKLDNLTKGWASSTPKIGLAMACSLFAVGLAWTFLFS